MEFKRALDKPVFIWSLGLGLLFLQFFKLNQWAHLYSANLFYFDQWDFLTPLFKDDFSGWELFRRQHGSHRMGAGLWWNYALKGLANWNSRSEAFLMAAVSAINSGLFLWLVHRLEGRLRLLDFFVASLFMSVNQYEVLVGAPNAGHSVLPQSLYLLLLVALARKELSVMQLASALIIPVLLSHTGFGFLFVFGSLAASVYFLARASKPGLGSEKKLFAALILGSAAALALFYTDYVSVASTESQALEPRSPFKMLIFPFFALSRLWGAAKPNAMAALGLLVGALMAVALWRAYRSRDFAGPRNRIICVSALGVGAFLAALTVGRVQNGFGAAVASRYYPYVVLAWIPVYVAFRNDWLRFSKSPRTLFVALSVLLLYSQEWRGRRRDVAIAEYYGVGKAKWAECYKQHLNSAFCSQSLDFEIHPDPHSARLDEKLQFLKERKLNLFAE